MKTKNIIDTGITGAKRQSWKRNNPREVLKRLIDQYPDMSKDEIWDSFDAIWVEFWDIVQDDKNQYRTQSEYWYANNFRSLVEPRAKRTKTTTSKPRPTVSVNTITNAIDARLNDHIEKCVEDKVKIVLLDMEMPSGKTLGQSTREELLEFGDFARRVAKHLKPGQIVEQVLSETDLKTLYVNED